MQALISSFSDLSVDQIIQKVYVKSSSQPPDYSQKDKKQLTTQQQLWHFQLQEENRELKEKIKELRSKFKKKEELTIKQHNWERQLKDLKGQLQEVVNQNVKLQSDLSRLRLKNSENSQWIKHSFEDSLNRSKSKRQCSCNDNKCQKGSPQKKNYPRQQKSINSNISPAKQLLPSTAEIAIICHLDMGNEKKSEIIRKKEHILALRSIIANQQKLIQQYRLEVKMNQFGEQPERNNTRQTASRICHLQRPTSTKTFKPLSSVGSIVKIKRG